MTRELNRTVIPSRARDLPRSARITAALLILSVTGCGLLDTNQPNIVDPGVLDSPEGAQTRRIGAIADFAFAKDGDGDLDLGRTDGQIMLGGLMADEFVLSTTPPTEQEIDQRRVFENNSTLFDVFFYLQRARAAAEDAAVALRQFGEDPDADPGIGEMLSLAGFAYVMFGEDFCSGVPFSRLDGDTLVFGAPQTGTETLQTAVARFDAALAEQGTIDEESQEIAFLASIGKGRALLDLGDKAGAAAAVGAVPTEYQYVTEHSESPVRIQNAIWAYGDGFLWSVSDLEGDVGLPFRTAEDPRVPFIDQEDVGLDGTTPQFSLVKYGDAAAPVVLADGIEARLIEAEALLPGNRAGMTAILNDLRDLQGLDPLPVPPNTDAAVDLLFSERAFWLFATGHRLGDMRRLIRQYGRAPDTVFPTGTYIKGGDYGEDVNLPIPIEEQNNPNAAGCLDRNP